MFGISKKHRRCTHFSWFGLVARDYWLFLNCKISCQRFDRSCSGYFYTRGIWKWLSFNTQIHWCAIKFLKARGYESLPYACGTLWFNRYSNPSVSLLMIYTCNVGDGAVLSQSHSPLWLWHIDAVISEISIQIMIASFPILLHFRFCSLCVEYRMDSSARVFDERILATGALPININITATLRRSWITELTVAFFRLEIIFNY